MNLQVIVLPEVFTQDFCNSVFENVKYTDRAGVGGDSHKYNFDVRRSNIFMLDGHLRYSQIYDAVCRVILDKNEEVYGFDLDSLQVLQYTEYSAEYEGEYKAHTDSSVPDERGLIRKLSLSIQLSDPSEYEGGNLLFDDIPDYNHEDAKKLGTVIMFPSYMTHQVTPVTSGLRKSLVGWVMGPQFR